MEIKKLATAGTMESSDAYVEIEPGNSGINIHLESVVAEQFGEEIFKKCKHLCDFSKIFLKKLHSLLYRSCGDSSRM